MTGLVPQDFYRLHLSLPCLRPACESAQSCVTEVIHDQHKQAVGQSGSGRNRRGFWTEPAPPIVSDWNFTLLVFGRNYSGKSLPGLGGIEWATGSCFAPVMNSAFFCTRTFNVERSRLDFTSDVFTAKFCSQLCGNTY